MSFVPGAPEAANPPIHSTAILAQFQRNYGPILMPIPGAPMIQTDRYAATAARSVLSVAAYLSALTVNVGLVYSVLMRYSVRFDFAQISPKSRLNLTLIADPISRPAGGDGSHRPTIDPSCQC